MEEWVKVVNSMEDAMQEYDGIVLDWNYWQWGGMGAWETT